MLPEFFRDKDGKADHAAQSVVMACIPYVRGESPDYAAIAKIICGAPDDSKAKILDWLLKADEFMTALMDALQEAGELEPSNEDDFQETIQTD